MLYRIQPWSLMGRGVFHRWAVLAGGADSELGETRASYPAATTTRPTSGTSSGVFQGSTCRAGGTTKPLLVGRGQGREDGPFATVHEAMASPRGQSKLDLEFADLSAYRRGCCGGNPGCAPGTGRTTKPTRSYSVSFTRALTIQCRPGGKGTGAIGIATGSVNDVPGAPSGGRPATKSAPILICWSPAGVGTSRGRPSASSNTISNRYGRFVSSHVTSTSAATAKGAGPGPNWVHPTPSA